MTKDTVNLIFWNNKNCN